MRALLDTSVLVAASVRELPGHARCRRWLESAERGELELVVAAHSLVETYSVLTRLPLQPRISPAEAQRLIEDNVLAFAEIATLTSKETIQHLGTMADLEIAGGATYDSLIARVAWKAHVDKIVTLNLEHFLRVTGDEDRDRVSLP